MDPTKKKKKKERKEKIALCNIWRSISISTCLKNEFLSFPSSTDQTWLLVKPYLLHFWFLFVCSWPVFFLLKAFRIFSVPHILKSHHRLSCWESVLIYCTGYLTALNTHPSAQGNSPVIFLHIMSFSPFPLYFLCSLVSDWASKFSHLFLSCPLSLVSLDDFLISKSSY